MSPESEGETLGKHKFYDQFISQSLPVILRNDCARWNFKKVIDAQVQNKTVKEYLVRKFGDKSLVTFTQLGKGAKEEFSQGVGQAKTYQKNYQEFNRLREQNNKLYLHYI